MKNYTVFTDKGTYTNIWAYTGDHAKRIVWKRTLGRIPMAAMTAVCQGNPQG